MDRPKRRLFLAALVLLAGATPDEVCARSIRQLTAAGVRHFYVSNLPIGRAAATLRRIRDLAGS